MDEETKEKRKGEVYEELTKLMQEWVNLTDAEDGTSGIMTVCVIAFESTRYGEEGEQRFRTDYLALPPTGYSSTVGILKETLWEIHHRGFGHCGHES